MEIRNQIRKIKVNEILVPALCAAGILYSGFTFFREMSGRFSAQREVIGNVSYRYRVAQRRTANRVVWEDVEQLDRVFNRDSIRTDEKSEATVTLRNGSRLELDPRSMVVLSFVDGETAIQVESGSVLVRDAKPGMRLRGPNETGPGFVRPRADTRITLEGDSTRISGDFEVNVDGKITHGRSALLNRSGLSEVRREDRAQGPEDNARFFADDPEVSVEFQWQTPPDSVELAEDRFFERVLPVLEGKGKAARSFAEGIYYWRVKGAPLADVRKFRIIRRPAVLLLRPVPGEVLKAADQPLAAFSWTESDLAQMYVLQISRDSKFASDVTEKTLQRTGISLSLPAGTYYWRVEAKGALNGSNRTSDVSSFSVADDRETATPAKREDQKSVKSEEKAANVAGAGPAARKAPVPVAPAAGQTVDMSQAEQIIFAWQPSPGASGYRLELMRAGQTIYTGQSTESRLILSDLTVLDVGDFSWRAIARFPDGSEEASTPVFFKIFLASQPDRPTLKQ